MCSLQSLCYSLRNRELAAGMSFFSYETNLANSRRRMQFLNYRLCWVTTPGIKEILDVKVKLFSTDFEVTTGFEIKTKQNPLSAIKTLFYNNLFYQVNSLSGICWDFAPIFFLSVAPSKINITKCFTTKTLLKKRCHWVHSRTVCKTIQHEQPK